MSFFVLIKQSTSFRGHCICLTMIEICYQTCIVSYSSKTFYYKYEYCNSIIVKLNIDDLPYVVVSNGLIP